MMLKVIKWICIVIMFVAFCCLGADQDVCFSEFVVSKIKFAIVLFFSFIAFKAVTRLEDQNK